MKKHEIATSMLRPKIEPLLADYLVPLETRVVQHP